MELTPNQIARVRSGYLYKELTALDGSSDTLMRVLLHVWGPDCLWVFRSFAHTLPDDLAALRSDLNRALYQGGVETAAKERCPELWAQLEREGEAAETERDRVASLSPEDLAQEFAKAVTLFVGNGTQISVH